MVDNDSDLETIRIHIQRLGIGQGEEGNKMPLPGVRQPLSEHWSFLDCMKIIIFKMNKFVKITLLNLIYIIKNE